MKAFALYLIIYSNKSKYLNRKHVFNGEVMAHDVFISYSTKNSEIAEKVHETLQSNGIKCWFAPSNIKTADYFAKEIIDGLNASRVVVLIFSEHAQASKYVNEEIGTAFSTNKRIVALKVDDSFPKDDMNFYLMSTQWLDASPSALEDSGSTIEDYYNRLVEAVKRTLDDWNPDGQCKKCHRMFYIDHEFSDEESLKKYQSSRLCQKCQKETEIAPPPGFLQRYKLPIIAVLVVLIAVSGFMLFSGNGESESVSNETVISIGYVGIDDYGDGTYSYSVIGSITQNLVNSSKDVIHIDFLDKSGNVVDSSDTKIKEVSGNILGSIDVDDKNVAKVSLELQKKNGKV